MKTKFRSKVNLKKEAKLLPGYVVVTLWCMFTIVVIGWIVLASFSTTKEIFSGNMLEFESGLHFENYSKALFKHNVAGYFVNSLIYTLISCVGVIVVSAPAAYVLSRFVFKGSKFFEKTFISALGIPAIMIIMPLFSLATAMSLVNSRIVLIILYIAINVPFNIFFLMTFFKSLPGSLEEAAAIDGCSPIRTFWKIMLPLVQPGIITVTIFNFIKIWNEYFMALIFTTKAGLKPVAVGLYSMVQSMRYTGDWAGMFAAVVIVCLPTFVMYVFLSERIIAGVTGGAVKG